MTESGAAAPRVREEEVEFSAMRAQGPGGQNVNKVSTAIHLRFDIRRSSLPPELKERLLALPGRRVTKDGVLVIKAQSARSQEQNRAHALERLQDIVAEAAHVQAPRKPTPPPPPPHPRPQAGKYPRSDLKASRGRVQE